MCVCSEIPASGSVNAVRVPRGSRDTGAQPTPYACPYANRPFILHPPAGQSGTTPPPEPPPTSKLPLNPSLHLYCQCCVSSSAFLHPSILSTLFQRVLTWVGLSMNEGPSGSAKDHRSAATHSETAFILMTVESHWAETEVQLRAQGTDAEIEAKSCFSYWDIRFHHKHIRGWHLLVNLFLLYICPCVCVCVWWI